ncbi:conserved hypothetical protein [Neospora caninum Liverpool]|uniref:Ribosomal RNA large subunit methyltransferase K/L-like methyltransferase domain-containing protein n=1 Tax=Neospora caninum (strain Liverpool) TaxID=572307 RepID=F0VAY2_NEOCL|nr:conserved hypothetical protein [Neospora caninum Liverpool]CBZ51358.1 conserved hypothetical protein [Neospora caninum Liverpool]CEL68677.1 TPA: hypothetical protein BN1204_044220 [Neospora caninum Liverpool]|eukprot:XP_003881391.1 conserved hypothetical protein [Neospora caninum Liverpool]
MAGVKSVHACRRAALTLFLSVRKGLEPVLVRELRTSPSLRDLCGGGNEPASRDSDSQDRRTLSKGAHSPQTADTRRVRLQRVQGGVVVYGADWEVASRVCTYTRIAETVWLRLAHSGGCTSEERLENALKKVKWKEFFPDLSLLPLVPLRVASFSSTLCNERRIRQVVENALQSVIADQTPKASENKEIPTSQAGAASFLAPPSAQSDFVKAMEPARRLLEALNFRLSLALASDSLFVDVQLSPRLSPRPYLYLSRFISASPNWFASSHLPSLAFPPSFSANPLGDPPSLAPSTCADAVENEAEKDDGTPSDSPVHFARDARSRAPSDSFPSRSEQSPPRPSAFPVLAELLRENRSPPSGDVCGVGSPEQYPACSGSSDSASPSTLSSSSPSSVFFPWSLAETSRAIRQEAKLRLLRERFASEQNRGEEEADSKRMSAEAFDENEVASASDACSVLPWAGKMPDVRVSEARREMQRRGAAWQPSARRPAHAASAPASKPRWQRSAFEKLLDSVAKAEEMAKATAQRQETQGAESAETDDTVKNEEKPHSSPQAGQAFNRADESCGTPQRRDGSPAQNTPSAFSRSPYAQSVSSSAPASSSSSPSPFSPSLNSASSSLSSTSPLSSTPSLPLRLPVEVELLRLQQLHFGRRRAGVQAAGLLPPSALPSSAGLVEAFESDDAMAAAVALASGIKRACKREKDVVIWDPFCGDGGLLLEVALLIKDDFPVCPSHIPSPLSLLSRVHEAEPAHPSSSSFPPSSPSSSPLSSLASSLPTGSSHAPGVVTLVGSDERALLLRAARQRLGSFHSFYSRSESRAVQRSLGSESEEEAQRPESLPERERPTEAGGDGEGARRRDRGQLRVGQRGTGDGIGGAESRICGATEGEKLEPKDTLRATGPDSGTEEVHREEDSEEDSDKDSEEDAITAVRRRASLPMFTVGPQIVSPSSPASPLRPQLDGEARRTFSFDELMHGARDRHSDEERDTRGRSQTPTAYPDRQTETETKGAKKEEERAGDEHVNEGRRQTRGDVENAILTEKIYVPDEGTNWGTAALPFRVALLHAAHHHVAPFLRGAFVLTRMPGRREGEFMGSAHKKAVLLYERFGHLIASRDDWRAVYVLTKGSAFQHYSRLDWERVITWRDVSDQPLQLLRWTGRKRALYASTTKAERESALEEIDMRLDAAEA